MKSLIDSERTKSIFLICLALLSTSLFLTSYLCPDQLCRRRSIRSVKLIHSSSYTSKEIPKIQLNQRAKKLSFDQIITDSTFKFNIKNKDVIVFLHIQKTGKLFKIKC